jgi:hypothetical protein
LDPGWKVYKKYFGSDEMNGADIERDIETLLKAKRLIKREEQTCAIRDGETFTTGGVRACFSLAPDKLLFPRDTSTARAEGN